MPSLGWEVLAWLPRSLPPPADEKQPLVLSDLQARFVLAHYEVDAVGAFIKRRSILEEAKGWGKSPLAGAISIAEFVGPVLFDHWGSDGEPLGRAWGTNGSPPPWIQIAAVSEDQTDNTYAAIWEFLAANEHRAAIDLGIDLGRTRLYLKERPGRLEPVTASAGAREGPRLTY